MKEPRLNTNSPIDLSSLNPPQREAVMHVDGPTLILAGAGSGKTRALTHKIAYLVSQGARPWRILAVTFTNKAAREMSTRAAALLGIPVDGLWIGTFHGICVRILRREADRWGIKRNFTIYDRDDQLATIKKAMKEYGIKKDRIPPTKVLMHIGKAKNNFTSPEQLEEKLMGPDAPVIASLYRRYNELLQEAGAFDFDDLLLKPVEMFGKHPDVLGDWQRRFDHILVDEYQDTNRTQYLLMRFLTGDYGHVTVVGDDDQSIYSWRGADIENILSFEKDYRNAKVIRLEQNYRSTKTILAAANTIVANNSRRMTKKLWTEGIDGAPVAVIECGSDRDEAERVVRGIENEMRELGFLRRDCVILYRTNAQSRAFEDVLRRRSMPYVIVGGLRFYERKEIKDILAYLRLLVNPDDAVNFARAITTPKRSIGEKTIDTVEKFARANGITIVAALNRADEYASGLTAKRLTEFGALLAHIDGMRKEHPIGTICANLVEEILYREYLAREHPENHEERMDNVLELVTAMNEFENTTEDDTLAAFLAEVSLMADVDSWSDEVDTVTLMTLHSAKGLEFKSVYIAGVERGLFPLPSTFEEDELLEEERRLFYVGITRARELLHITYASMRMRYGSFSGGESMFIKELPRETVRFESTAVSTQPERRESPSRPVRNQPIRRPMEFEDYSQEAQEEPSHPFRVGAFVRHPKFGRGKITAITGSGESLTLTIRFGSEDKKIMPQYARLTPG